MSERERGIARGSGILGAALATVAALAGTTVLTAQAGSVGLSSIRAQWIPNQTVDGFAAQAGDHFAWALAAGDFDGDGRDELATGIPFDDWIAGIERPDAGGVVVSRHYPATGLDPLKFLLQTPGLDPAEAGDLYSLELAVCDFNADGFEDLAVGVPGEDVDGHANAGAIQAHYGSASGVPSVGNKFVTQNSTDVPGDAEDDDQFGYRLACGDFDGDGFDDLVVGVPFENLGSAGWAGMIVILPGGFFGIDLGDAYSIDQNTSGIDGSSEDDDLFGRSLAVGNFDGDGYVDLAIGVIGEDGVGAVQILYGGVLGLDGARDLFWYDENLGGTRESGDYFGSELAAGDFDGDGFDDLAIGVEHEEAGTVGSDVNSGEVKIAYGAAGGFGAFPSRTQRFTQDSFPGAYETAQVGDHFGGALASGDFNGDGFADLAMSAPWEGISSATGRDGHVTVVAGTSSGLHVFRARGFVAGWDGTPGYPNVHTKYFGSALAAGDFDGDGHDDLGIGAPAEAVSGLGEAGSQVVLYGSLFSDGLEDGAALYWSDSSP